MACRFSTKLGEGNTPQFDNPSLYEQETRTPPTQPPTPQPDNKSRHFKRALVNPAKATPTSIEEGGEGGETSPNNSKNLCKTVAPQWDCLLNCPHFDSATKKYFTRFTENPKNMHLIRSTVHKSLLPFINSLKEKENEWKTMAKTVALFFIVGFVILIGCVCGGMVSERKFRQQFNSKISTFPNVFRQHVASKLDNVVEKTHKLVDKAATAANPATSRKKMAKLFVKGLSKMDEDDITQRLSWL